MDTVIMSIISTEAVICFTVGAWLPIVDSVGPSRHLQISFSQIIRNPLRVLSLFERLSELCVERPVGVGVFCAVSRGDEGVQQQVH